MIPEMMEGLVDKKVRAFYIFGENHGQYRAGYPHKVEHELESAEFLICQDIFFNETTRICRCGVSGGGLERERGHLYQLRAAGKPGENGQSCLPERPGPIGGSSRSLAKRFGHNWKPASGQETLGQ